MKKLTIIFFAQLLFTSFYISTMAQSNFLPSSKQLMVVITDDWSNLQGTIYVFNKQDDKWIFKFSNPIVVGSKGLGVGEGLTPLSIENAPVKKEGDMKSPAGFFSIGTAFGYADYKDTKWINNPYVKATDTLICVDDPHSAYYNTLIDNNPSKTDYKSFEHMRLQKDYYKWGLFINHNSPKVTPGSGSCVFMHIWGSNHEGTAGCTAMTETDMLRILHWIKASDNPLLVQLPKAEYLQFKERFNLPNINNL
jgi:L,D-peptidoglycan transpeptidase YkuD (ErfK/YbiS/YcfS/YnhG family)